MKTFKFLLTVGMMLVSCSAFAQFTTGGSSARSNDDDSTLQVGYKGYAELGYGLGVGDYGEGRIEVSTTHGYQFCPYFFAGVGVGYSYYHEGSVSSVPIFADFRASYPVSNTKFAPFFDFKVGYAVTDVAGFYLSPSVGLRIAMGERRGFNISLGYEMQKAEFKFARVNPSYSYDGSWTYYYSYYLSKENCGALTIKLGFDF